MEAISLRMAEGLLDEIDTRLKEHRYATRTEFIRDAIREKLSELERREILATLDDLHGSKEGETTDEDLHAVRDALAQR